MKTFKVKSGEWTDTIKIDETIWETYESQAQEAISRSIEKWLSLDEDVPITLLTEAYDVNDPDKNNNVWIMNAEAVFENVGRSDMARIVKSLQ